MKNSFERIALDWAADLPDLSYESPAEDSLPGEIEQSVLNSVERYAELHGLEPNYDDEVDRQDAQLELCGDVANWVAEELRGELEKILDDVNGYFGLETGPAIWTSEAVEFWLENMDEVEELLGEYGITGSISDQLTTGAFLVMCRRAEVDVQETIDRIDEGELSELLFDGIFGEE